MSGAIPSELRRKTLIYGLWPSTPLTLGWFRLFACRPLSACCLFLSIFLFLSPSLTCFFSPSDFLKSSPSVANKANNCLSYFSRCSCAEDVHNHFKKCEVEYLQFAFRWMNNLLMRELPLRCTIRLWDTYQVLGGDQWCGVGMSAFVWVWVYLCRCGRGSR